MTGVLYNALSPPLKHQSTCTMSLMHTVLAVLLLTISVACTAPKDTTGVIKDNSATLGMKLVSLPYDAAPLLAWGGYDDTINKDGWSYLSIHSNETEPNVVQAQSSGYLEASLTTQRMFEFATNKHDGFGWSPNLRTYVKDNQAYMQGMHVCVSM